MPIGWRIESTSYKTATLACQHNALNKPLSDHTPTVYIGPTSRDLELQGDPKSLHFPQSTLRTGFRFDVRWISRWPPLSTCHCPAWLPPLAYLAADCQLVSDEGRRQLRSVTSRTCIVRRTYSNYGDRCFAAAGPKL